MACELACVWVLVYAFTNPETGLRESTPLDQYDSLAACEQALQYVKDGMERAYKDDKLYQRIDPRYWCFSKPKDV